MKLSRMARKLIKTAARGAFRAVRNTIRHELPAIRKFFRDQTTPAPVQPRQPARPSAPAKSAPKRRGGGTYVKAYTKSDGTHVAGYTRR